MHPGWNPALILMVTSTTAGFMGHVLPRYANCSTKAQKFNFCVVVSHSNGRRSAELRLGRQVQSGGTERGGCQLFTPPLTPYLSSPLLEKPLPQTLVISKQNIDRCLEGTYKISTTVLHMNNPFTCLKPRGLFYPNGVAQRLVLVLSAPEQPARVSLTND